jgi:hypothetical protein
VAARCFQETDFVIAGAEAGGKLDKAVELRVAVIDEAITTEMLADHSRQENQIENHPNYQSYFPGRWSLRHYRAFACDQSQSERNAAHC